MNTMNTAMVRYRSQSLFYFLPQDSHSQADDVILEHVFSMGCVYFALLA